MSKLSQSFYQKPALEIAKDFLGKYLVFNSPKGKISGKIVDVEAYPAFSDKVSHGNKRTNRTEVMYREGGYTYVYLIYGIYHQFAVVVNKKDIADVVFIRAVIPSEGINIMEQNFGRSVKRVNDLTKSPGNLCKSFGIDLSLYGVDMTEDILFIEDRDELINPLSIITANRAGINQKLEGWDKKIRFYIK